MPVWRHQVRLENILTAGSSDSFDVAPIPRQLLTRPDDRFSGSFSLTLVDERAWCQVSKRAVWAVVIMVSSPRLKDGLGFGQRGKLVDVQALVTDAPVK